MKDQASEMESMSFVAMLNRWVYSLLVRDERNDEESELLQNNESNSDKEMLVCSL